jgi:predicted nucleic acid-binding protein
LRVALDTNILAYAEGVNGAAMRRAALELVQKLPEGAALLPVQTLGELFHLLVRKAGRPRAKARMAVLSWQDAFPVIETSAEVMLAAADLATDHQLRIWDAVILSRSRGSRMPSSSFGRPARGLHVERSDRHEPVFDPQA